MAGWTSAQRTTVATHLVAAGLLFVVAVVVFAGVFVRAQDMLGIPHPFAIAMFVVMAGFVGSLAVLILVGIRRWLKRGEDLVLFADLVTVVLALLAIVGGGSGEPVLLGLLAAGVLSAALAATVPPPPLAGPGVAG